MNGSSLRTPRPSFLACLCLVLPLGACAFSAGEQDASTHEPPQALTVQLPEDWLTVERLTFERMLEEHLPADRATSFDAPTRATLAAALNDPESRTRATLWLARSRDPLAAEPLLARLEARELGPERGSDAADVIAAAGLAEFEPNAERAERLALLATGEQPHPDLEVRVECARAALLQGNDSPIPFLLSVLLIGTNQGRASGEFWPAPLRSAWARERAAEILAWRSGLENRYSADASIGDREREVARLALQLPTASE